MEGFKSNFENAETTQVLEDIDALEGQDFYTRLGVQESASLDEIKGAFRKLSAKFHPDKVNSDELMRENYTEVQKRLGEAYNTLNNTASKAKYDAKLKYYSSTDAAPAYKKPERGEKAPPQQSKQAEAQYEYKQEFNAELELMDFRTYLRGELDDDLSRKGTKTIAGIEREITAKIIELRSHGVSEEKVLDSIKGPLLAYYAKQLINDSQEKKSSNYSTSIMYALARLGIDSETLQRVKADPQKYSWF